MEILFLYLLLIIKYIVMMTIILLIILFLIVVAKSLYFTLFLKQDFHKKVITDYKNFFAKIFNFIF